MKHFTKNHQKLQIILLAFCLGFLSIDVSAQGRNEKYWTIGGQLNAFNYFGDLNPLSQRFSTEISFTRPNFGIEVSRRLGPRWSIRGSFSYGRLRGDDNVAAEPNDDNINRVARYGRNLHFRNDILELAFVATFDIFPSKGRFYRRRYFTPYLLAGIAGIYHNPQAKLPTDMGDEWVNLKPLRTEGQGLDGYAEEYTRIQPAIPLGIGARWRLTDRLDLSFEIAFRMLMFDHIDDVGGRYPNIADLESDLARRMYDRSAEPIAAVTGNSRDLSALQQNIGATPTNQYGSLEDVLNNQPLQTFVGPNGETYTRLINYGLQGEMRGNTPSENDMYLVTGFHVNYIFTTRRTPRFR